MNIILLSVSSVQKTQYPCKDHCRYGQKEHAGGVSVNTKSFELGTTNLMHSRTTCVFGIPSPRCFHSRHTGGISESTAYHRHRIVYAHAHHPVLRITPKNQLSPTKTKSLWMPWERTRCERTAGNLVECRQIPGRSNAVTCHRRFSLSLIFDLNAP
jgi:hypothetical protein